MPSRLCPTTAVDFADMENFSIMGELPENVRRLRKARGLSLAEVTSRMASVGVPLSINGLSKLELGNRGADLDLLVALAKALGVPPLVLIFPFGHVDKIELFPGTVVDTWAAAKWFTGETPFPVREIGVEEDVEEWPTTYFREQDKLISEWSRVRRGLGDARAKLGGQGRQTPTDRPDLLQMRLMEVEYLEEALRSQEDQLRRHRLLMRKAGLDPGDLLPELAHVDGASDGQR